MHSINVNTKTTTDVTFNGKDITAVLMDICDIAHGALIEKSLHFDDNFDKVEGNGEASLETIKAVLTSLETGYYEILELLGD